MADSKAEFVEYKTDGVWQHFLREKNGQSAQCKLCKVKTTLKTIGGSTKGLHEHLRRVHEVTVLKRKAELESATANEDKPKRGAFGGSMLSFIVRKNDNTLPATLAWMTARDGLPFRVFVTSSDLRRGLVALGFGNLPKSVNNVKQLVMGEGERVRSAMMTEMASQKRKGQRFSVTFDEWTSTRNRRYMNVNVHGEGGRYWNLGLKRVQGSMPAERCVELLQAKLAEFGLSLEKDIVCVCTDGASVMSKVGRLISAEHQLCYAHGVQLAVLDVLYKRKVTNVTVTAAATVTAETDARNPDYDDSDGEDEECEVEQALELVEENYDILVELSEAYQTVVSKVRKVVKMFKHSPTKNDDTLQPYVTREFGKEMSLILDCKTRWSSLVDMLARFVQLRGPVQKALIDLGQSAILTDADFTVISEVVSCLEPLKVAVNALCKRDTNLISAQAALHFCIIQLQKQNCELARTIAEVLESRVKERYGLHASVLQYLHSPSARETATNVFTIPGKDAIKKFIRRMVDRLEDSASTETAGTAEDNTGVATETAGQSHVTSILTLAKLV